MTPPTPAVKWWVRSRDMVLNICTYLSEYKGWGMFCIRNHIPFDIALLDGIGEKELARYRAVIVPNMVCLSEEQKKRLLAYADGGGTVVVTGAEAGTRDTTGAKREKSLWDDHKPAQEGLPEEMRCGSGRIVHTGRLPGRSFLSGKPSKEAHAWRGLLGRFGIHPLVAGEAPLYVQAYLHGNDTVLHLVNYGWVGRKELKVQGTKAAVSLPLDGGKRVKRITVSSPEGGNREVPHESTADRVTFTVEVPINLLVKVEME